jgi:hypothetical protein
MRNSKKIKILEQQIQALTTKLDKTITNMSRVDIASRYIQGHIAASSLRIDMDQGLTNYELEQLVKEAYSVADALLEGEDNSLD